MAERGQEKMGGLGGLRRGDSWCLIWGSILPPPLTLLVALQRLTDHERKLELKIFPQNCGWVGAEKRNVERGKDVMEKV